MLKNVVRGVMSHIRDVYVVHCIDKRVFISIPLTHEKGMMFQSARIENGELIIQGKMPSMPLNGKPVESDALV